ncbi:hypothetical protein [Marinobacter oulmenensis]|uniref:Oxidoreductase molybdopterin-binding domain-containing protein n=1 Tax=Marinobacter oulmenensis TaxID=643747 RepID=A0A840UG12_9GAMM|nr:hypothetical protein [Marinobacter oulmenensis]MBB5321661.1 hypothetical protein [Marinobacter oulmenensis]
MSRFLMIVLVVLALPGHVLAGPELKVTNGERTLVLDRAELEEALPQTVIETTSPYYDGTVEFSGPSLKAVIEHLGIASESEITLAALNDYRVTGSLDQMLAMDAIVATRRNGKVMSVRERGPFWVMLPLSQRTELDNEGYHRFMVWQLSRIELH